MEGDKRKSDEKLDQPIERKCRKTQTIMERYLISGESTKRTNGGKVGVHGAGHEEEADAGHQAGAGHGEADTVRVDSTGYEEADGAHLARENDIYSGETGSAWRHVEWCAGEGGQGGGQVETDVAAETCRVVMEERGVVRAKVTAGGCVPGLVVGEGELDEAVGGEGVYAGAGESHVAADNRGTGRDTGNVGGCDPGVTVGDGGTDKAVCGVDVDVATELRVKGREDGTAGGGDPGLTARKGRLDKTRLIT